MRFRRLLALLVVTASLSACSREPDAAATTQTGTDKGLTYNSPLDLAEKAGIELYPKAHIPNGKSSVTDSTQETRYEVVMTTPDEPEKVLKFYESKLDQAQRMSANSNVMGMSRKRMSRKRSMVSVTATRKGNDTEVHAVAIVEKGSGSAK